MHVFVRIHSTREKLFYFLVAKSLRMTHILSINFFKEIFLDFLYYSNCFICRPSDIALSEDSGIEPRTVATLPLTVRRSNYSARSHPQKLKNMHKAYVNLKTFLQNWK